jgi:ABC-type nitrate/sulfonate/bicarbonate transport system substrate-binding protein
LAAIGIAVLVAAGIGEARAAPVPIRAAWLIVPNMIFPLMTMPSDALQQAGIGPDVLRHYGRSYVLDLYHVTGTSPQITALAANDLDLAPLSFSAFAFAVTNAHLADLRIIADGLQEGVPGWYSVAYLVLKDSPIHKVEDLKGQVLAVNAFGGATDLDLRLMLHKHGLDDKRDLSIIEVAVPNMKSSLIEHKVALVAPLGTFAFDPALAAASRTLFTGGDAAGVNETIFLTMRTGFIQQHRAVVVDFLADELRFLHWLTDPAHHDAAVSLVAQFAKVPAQRIGFAFTRNDSYRDPKGLPNLTALQRTLDEMRALGFLHDKVVVAKYADLGLVKQAALERP